LAGSVKRERWSVGNFPEEEKTFFMDFLINLNRKNDYKTIVSGIFKIL